MSYLSICLISFLTLLLFSVSLFIFGLYLLMMDFTIFLDFDLLSLQSSMLEMTILLDWMSLFFMSFVLLISSLVIFYSMEYMSQDKFINRFILLVLMFVLSMVFLIISPNIISILLGWDGLGLVSYCLVIYFQNIKSYNAGMLTALSNRIGDVLILLAIAWFLNYGSWSFIFYLDLMKSDFEMKWISYLIVFAAMTKSAQIPFSAWLPAAMAAPTPVSALVHSSTLVTAGVYLLIRFNNLIISSYVSQLLLLLSGLTMFMAGLGANFEFDLKKIIALSTLSQLGLMMSVLSMGYPLLAFFHLLTHALFKALLFMCAGVVIHSMKNFQDIRYMGALINQMPMTMSYFNVANLALCGFPFLAGFYSKDLILEMSSFSSVNILSYFLYYFSTGLTVCYSLRLMYYSMFMNFMSWTFHSLFDSSKIMTGGMMGLLLMSVIGGSLLSWLIFPTPYVVVLSLYQKMMTLIVCIGGGLVGYYFSQWSLYLKSKMVKYKTGHFMGSMWFLPYIATMGVVFYPLLISNSFMKTVDYGWSEKFGGQNLNSSFSSISQSFQIMQNNNLKIYMMMFFLWVSVFFVQLV